jgi:uncharacterized protein (DUF952 family)
MALIYHIVSAADWEQARRDGEYTGSTRGLSLAEQGFIHASTAPQVAPVANAFYGDDQDLVVLVIDTRRLGPELRYEPVPGWDDPFPHIYGPLNVDAVVTALPLDRDASGRFAFAADGGS